MFRVKRSIYLNKWNDQTLTILVVLILRSTQSSSFGKILKFQRKYCLAIRYNWSKLYYKSGIATFSTHSVCLSGTKFVRSTKSSSFWLKSSSNQSGICQQSVSTQWALSEQSESTQNKSHESIQSEPKILRLVIL